MARRVNGEGSIRPRKKGGYEARYYLADGSRKSVYGRSQSETRRKLAEAIRQRDTGTLLLGDPRQTVGQYLTSWLQSVKPEVELSTYISYEGHVRRHIVPAFGRIRLSELTPQHVQHLIAKMLAEGLAPNTVRNMRSALHLALGEAQKLGLVSRNAASLTRKPKARRGEMHVYDDAQVRHLLEVATEMRHERHEALLTLMVTTGARLGELLALTWRNVNMERGYIQIQTNARRYPGQGIVIKDTKTGPSRRKIELSETAVAALRRHRARQNEERLRQADIWHDLDLVFATNSGRAIAASNFWREYRRIITRAGLPYIRPHDLRHTAATLLLLKGVHPKKVSEMLGHASVAITLSIYSHVLPSMHRDAADAMDELLTPNVRDARG